MAAKFRMWLYENPVTPSTLLNQLFKEGLFTKRLSEDGFEGYQTPLREGKTNGMYQFFTNTCNSLPQYDKTNNLLNLALAVIWGEKDEILKWQPQKTSNGAFTYRGKECVCHRRWAFSPRGSAKNC